ncbi:MULTISPECIES: lipid-binding SYLF domain-containing protein [Thiorhodovibrio]|uniref:lipid-binding SYLF domain-containing protein n=1 Tax=Thiorhodovibrio TaxID=61593 RepID=UPI001914157C|nr:MULTISPECIES: hypothetical protein [Thiorhodovibrio]MBK5967218.1 hypothetical protein [Thiorhodovibrio winogradskyi]WPL14891.1 hypothetical protein Thiosp_04747 [Thiorhodovibrio litoralis]
MPKTHFFTALLLALCATSVNAQLLDGLKQGAETVGDMAGKAAGAVTGTIESTQKSLGNEATPAETREKIDAMAAETLQRLFADQPDSRALYERSAGYAVFDKREASFYVVAGYGRGVAVDRQTDARTYMKMATTGAGLSFGLGGFASQMVILFETEALLERFVTQGLDATAEVGAMTGEEKDQLALRFNDGKAVFVLTGKGWKIGAKLTGSRYWPDETLNQR